MYKCVSMMNFSVNIFNNSSSILCRHFHFGAILSTFIFFVKGLISEITKTSDLA